MVSLLCAVHCIALHCWDLACGQEKPHMFSCQIEVTACFPFFLKKILRGKKKKKKGLGTIVLTQAHLQHTHTHTHTHPMSNK